MRRLASTQHGTSEGRLHRVAIRDAQHPDDDTTRSFLAALHLEVTALETKLRDQALDYVVQYVKPPYISFQSLLRFLNIF